MSGFWIRSTKTNMALMLRWMDGARPGKAQKRLSLMYDQVIGAIKSMRTNVSENFKITGRMVVPG